MRILIIHNYYQDPGGEDVVFEQEKTILSNNHEVDSLTFRNKKGWRGLIQTLLSPWNVFAANRIKARIRSFRPDVIHIHNIHYAIGPLAIRTIKKQGIPVVMTLHNFRLICPSAILFHNNSLFLDSIEHDFPWKAVRAGVHANSSLKTTWLALTIWIHKKIGTWQAVDQYIVLTEFARSIFLRSTLGLPKSKITIKPNFIAPPLTSPTVRSNHFLFIGRLSSEKGIDTLLSAFAGSERQLRIAGDGPLRDVVQQFVKSNTNISYLGNLSKPEVLAQLTTCSALIFPSIWYEGMPMTLIEAFATSTPVLASNLGAMQTMIKDGENGLLFEPGKTNELRNVIAKWDSLAPEEKSRIAQKAQMEFHDKYTASNNLQLLTAVYEKVNKTKT